MTGRTPEMVDIALKSARKQAPLITGRNAKTQTRANSEEGVARE